MLWMLLRHTDLRRIQPFVVFLQAGPFEREVAALGIPTAVLAAGRLRQLASFARVVRALAALLRKHRPHVVLNWMPKTQIYGATAAGLAGMANRLTWWQHGIPSGHWIDRVATLLPARAIGCSSRSASDAQRRQWPHRQTFVVHPGIESPKRLPASDLAFLRRSLGIRSEAIVLGTVGRLQPWKGQHRLLRIVNELRQRGREVHGVVVGGDAFGLSPEYELELRAMSNRLGLAERVTFTGQVSDPAPYLQIMDVFVATSLGEPFGIALIEAMAQGVPVVAFDADGPAEIVATSQGGRLVTNGDEDELLAAVDQLATDAAVRRRLGEAARRRFTTAFGADRMADEIWQHLEGIRDGEVNAALA